jgi:hypothetical protein
MTGKLPLSGPPLLLYKLRTGGITWLLERLQDEWRLPRTGLGQSLFRGARVVARAARRSSRSADISGRPSGVLYAFYDLGVAPITFDFLWFLVGAELERQRRGCASIHAVIVPGLRTGLRKENPELENSLDPAARGARVHAIVVPACALLPSLSGVTVASSRAQAEQLVELAGEAVFPARYEPNFPSYPGPHEPLRAAREEGARVAVLRATAADLRAVDAWLAAHRCGPRLVTVTLRSYNYAPARNSNIAAWATFARSLDPARFSVVFVPDTAQCIGGLPPELRNFRIFGEAAMAVGLRMALYQRAYLNLGVNTGPMGLCWLNDQTRYITFKILTGSVPNTTPEYMKFLGFEPGKSLPFATPWQQWVWAEDEFEIIEDAVSAMLMRLEESPDQTHANRGSPRGGTRLIASAAGATD